MTTTSGRRSLSASWVTSPSSPDHRCASPLTEPSAPGRNNRGLTLDTEALARQAQRRPRATVRRLGFLLEHAGTVGGLDALAKIATGDYNRTPLDPGVPHDGRV